MLKRYELSEPRSCLNKAAGDEPVFVLRAKDPLAAQTIRHWATMAEGYHEPKKIKEAFELADAMDSWRNPPTQVAPETPYVPIPDHVFP